MPATIEIKLESIIPLRKPKPRSSARAVEHNAEEITGLSEDTLKRRYPNRIKKLSERRVGMKLRDALAIANGE